MKDTVQAEALRLADALEGSYWEELPNDAATELRRLHEREKSLVAEVERANERLEKMGNLSLRVDESNVRLRAIVSDCLKSLGNGSGCDPVHASIDFMSHAPAEVAAVVADLRAQVIALQADAERYRWLRSKASLKTAYDVYGNGCHWSIGFFSDDSRKTFDACVDAARTTKEAP